MTLDIIVSVKERTMRFATLALIVLATVLVDSADLAAQEPGESPIAAMLRKGVNEFNDLKYADAQKTARDLLGLESISDEFRRQALQLLVAALYPEDKDSQRPDSATKYIKSLIAMGAEFIPRDISWRGLDTLYTRVVLNNRAAAVAVAPGAALADVGTPMKDSLPSIMALVRDGRSTPEVVERANLDCGRFPFEDLDAALAAARRNADLPEALRRMCTRLLVEVDPPNAMLTVAGREVGTVQPRGDLWWVDPGTKVEVAVNNGKGNRSSLAIDMPRGRFVQSKFFLPQDTLVWALTRTPIQVATDLHLFDPGRYSPSTPKPREPVRPNHMNAFLVGTIWGLVSGGAAFGAAMGVPALGCNDSQTVPAGQTWRVRGARYTAGQSVNLGEGMGCTMRISAGSGGGMLLLSSLFSTGKHRGANNRYAEAMKDYPNVYKSWDDRERQTYAESNPDVRQAIANQQTRLAQVQADNTALKLRNAQLPAPQYFVRDMRQVDIRAASRVADAVSDVDTRIPKAAGPNANAVAIVIGNRDYQVQGVPKVDYAIRDAVSMANYLVEAFGFSRDRVILDTNVSSGRLSELFGTASDARAGALADLVQSRPENSVDIFVFYSGHGAPDGTPAKRFLVPVDANPDRLRATGYNIDQLYTNLSALKARSVTVAIDACFTGLSDGGAVFSGRSALGAGKIKVEVTTVGGENTQVYAAAAADQTARWRKDQGHGLFTYFFLKGIQGAADANSDSRISAGELEAYVKQNVGQFALERLSGARQNPEVTAANKEHVLVSFAAPR